MEDSFRLHILKSVSCFQFTSGNFQTYWDKNSIKNYKTSILFLGVVLIYRSFAVWERTEKTKLMTTRSKLED